MNNLNISQQLIYDNYDIEMIHVGKTIINHILNHCFYSWYGYHPSHGWFIGQVQSSTARRGGWRMKVLQDDHRRLSERNRRSVTLQNKVLDPNFRVCLFEVLLGIYT